MELGCGPRLTFALPDRVCSGRAGSTCPEGFCSLSTAAPSTCRPVLGINRRQPELVRGRPSGRERSGNRRFVRFRPRAGELVGSQASSCLGQGDPRLALGGFFFFFFFFFPGGPWGQAGRVKSADGSNPARANQFRQPVAKSSDHFARALPLV